METDALNLSQPPKKRVARYFRFQLQPGDLALLDQLPAEQRSILLTEGRYKERAEKLNIAVGTVRSRLHRARAALEALRATQPDASAPPN